MKVLWVCLRLFDENSEKQTAVWLKALALKLTEHSDLTLANVSTKKEINTLLRFDYKNIQQWALPHRKLDKKGMPPLFIQNQYERILDEYQPDIIQIWGSENPLGLLPFANKYPAKKILTMQGVLASIGSRSLLGLSLKEIVSTIGLRELYFRRNIVSIAKSFDKNGVIESNMIKQSDIILTQSDWTDAQINHINPNAKYFRTHRVLRSEFINCKQKWDTFNHPKPIIYSAAVGYTLKGLHILIKALQIVKVYFPSVMLRLAGSRGRTDILGNGYMRMITKLINRFDLDKNVEWIGPLSANEIINELQTACVFVNPSFVESYSMVLAEAMTIGTPSVVSFAGAMPELAENNKEALFFSPGDYKQMAYLIVKILSDDSLSSTLSKNAQARAQKRNIDLDIAEEQKELYKEILGLNK